MASWPLLSSAGHLHGSRRSPQRTTLLGYSSEVQQPQQPAALHAAPHGLPGSLYDLQ
ncbi:hypothetical protein ACWHAM_26755 [Paenibacillus terrae]